MAEKLIVYEDQSYFRIVWELEDGDIGTYVGDLSEEDFLKEDPPKDKEEAKCYFLEKEAKTIFQESDKKYGDVVKDSYGYGWVSKKDAQMALKRIKVAIKAGLAGRPWPEWAMIALGEGWTYPKGWKP